MSDFPTQTKTGEYNNYYIRITVYNDAGTRS